MSAVLEEKRTVILPEARMALAEQWRQDWVVNAAEGDKLADVLKPDYWAHVASKMQPLDHVEVRAETGEWIAQLLVTTVGRNWAHVKLLQEYRLVSEDAGRVEAASPYDIAYKGPQRKHCVIRKADAAVLAEGLGTKVEAMSWLDQYQRTTGA